MQCREEEGVIGDYMFSIVAALALLKLLILIMCTISHNHVFVTLRLRPTCHDCVMKIILLVLDLSFTLGAYVKLERNAAITTTRLVLLD